MSGRKSDLMTGSLGGVGFGAAKAFAGFCCNMTLNTFALPT